MGHSRNIEAYPDMKAIMKVLFARGYLKLKPKNLKGETGPGPAHTFRLRFYAYRNVLAEHNARNSRGKFTASGLQNVRVDHPEGSPFIILRVVDNSEVARELPEVWDEDGNAIDLENFDFAEEEPKQELEPEPEESSYSEAALRVRRELGLE